MNPFAQASASPFDQPSDQMNKVRQCFPLICALKTSELIELEGDGITNTSYYRRRDLPFWAHTALIPSLRPPQKVFRPPPVIRKYSTPRLMAKKVHHRLSIFRMLFLNLRCQLVSPETFKMKLAVFHLWAALHLREPSEIRAAGINCRPLLLSAIIKSREARILIRIPIASFTPIFPTLM